MATATLADPISGIGTIANIAQFVNLGDKNADDTHTSADSKDRYIMHQVDQLARLFGADVSSPAVTTAAQAFGIDEDRVFFEVVRLPQDLIDLADAQGGLSDEDINGRYEEIWVAAYGDHNDENGVKIDNVNFVRVA